MTNGHASRARRTTKPTQPAPPATEPEATLSAEDLSRHQRMLKLLAEAEQLETQMKQLGSRRAELLSAFKIWSEELHERYRLAIDGSEGVTPDGTITRKQ